jgi:hypothetical protein
VSRRTSEEQDEYIEDDGITRRQKERERKRGERKRGERQREREKKPSSRLGREHIVTLVFGCDFLTPEEELLADAMYKKPLNYSHSTTILTCSISITPTHPPHTHVGRRTHPATSLGLENFETLAGSSVCKKNLIHRAEGVTLL